VECRVRRFAGRLSSRRSPRSRIIGARLTERRGHRDRAAQPPTGVGQPASACLLSARTDIEHLYLYSSYISLTLRCACACPKLQTGATSAETPTVLLIFWFASESVGNVLDAKSLLERRDLLHMVAMLSLHRATQVIHITCAGARTEPCVGERERCSTPIRSSRRISRRKRTCPTRTANEEDNSPC